MSSKLITSLFDSLPSLQVRSLKQKCDAQDMELKNLHKTAQQEASLAEKESSKCRVAREFAKSVAEQVFSFIQSFQ